MDDTSPTPVTTERRRFRFPRPRRTWWIVLAILGGLLALGAAGAAYATYDYAREYDGLILPGSSIAGVDVSGMSSDEALAAVKAEIRAELHRSVTVEWGDRTWKVTPKQLGARSDARAAVQAALGASGDTSLLKKMKMRLLGDDLGFARDVAIKYPKKGVHGFVEGVAAGLDREPVEAALDYSTGWVEVTQPKPGREVMVDKSDQALRSALRGGDASVSLAVREIEPETSADAYEQVLLLRIGENKLYLYEDGKITHEWSVATGQPEYPTPQGQFEIVEKRYLPTWVNPDPEGWGASLPKQIGPGPGNPLGTRALNWSAPLIRFHGTSATYSLGYNASHGCVRMANSDVEILYDLVEVGTPIVSTQVAELKPLYASGPDPIVVEEDATGDNQPDGKDGKDD